MIRLLILSILLTGCATRVEYRQVKIPVMYCPSVEIETQPLLAIDGITEQTSPGEVAKRYHASIIQLTDYCGRLKKNLEYYNSVNQSYEEMNLDWSQ